MAEALRRARPGEDLEGVARRKINQWVNATGITQVQFGERIGKPQAWISRYLSGDVSADLETLAAMADVFGHSLTALLGVASDPNDQIVIDAYHALPADARAFVIPLMEMMGRRRRGRGR